MTTASLDDLLHQATNAHRTGHLEHAAHLYRQVLAQVPDHADALHMLGLLTSQQGHHADAARYIQQAIALDAQRPDFHTNLGEVWRKQGMPEQAVASYRRALHIAPDFAQAHYNLANVLKQQDDLPAAIHHYQHAVQVKPGYTSAHYNLGNALLEHGNYDAAIKAYEQTLALKPDHAEAHNNLGSALKHTTGMVNQAIEHYRTAVRCKPDFAEAHYNLATLLHTRNHLEPAIAHFRETVRSNPEHVHAYFSLGNALMDQGNIEAAIRAYRRTIALKPDFVEAHNNLGSALSDTRHYEEAVSSYQRAIELHPNDRYAHGNMAQALVMQGKLDEAQAAFQRVIQFEPNNTLLRFRSETLCPIIPQSNAEIDATRAGLLATLDRYAGQRFNIDMATLHVSGGEPPYILRYYGHDNLDIYTKWAALFQGYFPTEKRHVSREKPHIAFLVTHGHESVFLKSMQGIINRLSGEQFRMTIVCSGEAGAQQIRPAITNPAVEYLPIPPRFDHAVERIRAARFDLIAYWEVGSDVVNYFLPFCRLAPIQCGSWGDPNTSGIPQMDYYLSCEGLETPASDARYSETLIRLKHLHTCYERPPVPERLLPRAEYGLPDTAHLYFCSQNLRKVHPDVDPVFADILRRDPHGLLLFIEERQAAITTMLRQRLQRTMPDVVERVRFVPRMDRTRYLNLVALADVVLDTYHYNGHNTTYDAIAAGVPVVTLPSDYQHGRYTAAVYRQMGVTDCIASSVEEYITLALRLATDRAERADIAARLHAASGAIFENQHAVDEMAEFFEYALETARNE